MAKNNLKSFSRFELLELIYNLRKENQELTKKCEDLTRQMEEAHAEYERRLEELRMEGAARDLQVRMKKIEEQLQLLQKLTSLEDELPGVAAAIEDVSRVAGSGPGNRDGPKSESVFDF
jgi:predicted nuclease with TOPRIM domain